MREGSENAPKNAVHEYEVEKWEKVNKQKNKGISFSLAIRNSKWIPNNSLFGLTISHKLKPGNGEKNSLPTTAKSRYNGSKSDGNPPITGNLFP